MARAKTAKTRSRRTRRPRRDDRAVRAEVLRAMRDDFEANPTNTLMQNAVSQVSVQDIAMRRDVVVGADFDTSIRLDDWTATWQKSSGRCWLFAGLNLFRVGAMKKMNLKDFEFSQNYVMFWDKLEKANYFLEAVLETADREPGDRVVAFLLEHILEDGGQWNMFVNLVRKHGLVPKKAMPETESSSNTRAMNAVLRAKLRENARTLRDMKAGGASGADLQAAKAEMLNVVYRILRIHLGPPPERLDWQWRDKKKKFHRRRGMTPQSFAAAYVTVPYQDYVCLVHDPRPTSPVERTFTVEYLGNVVGGDPVLYLNVDIGVLKRSAIRALQAGEPVWFGCDVGKHMDRKSGLWDADLLDYEGVYGTPFELDKSGRLQYGETCMTHAMLFTGVDLVGGKPRRWRVENSWGTENGRKGFYLMNDSWFDEYVFEIAARKSRLSAGLRKALARKPIVLPPWDPMGALARG